MILVDTSVWIEYFRRGEKSKKLDFLIEENLILTNDLILTELIPALKIRRQQEIINLLLVIEKLALSINWNQLMDFQFNCLKNGLNGIGIPDLLLAQNAVQNRCPIYSFDNHFKLMKDILGFELMD